MTTNAIIYARFSPRPNAAECDSDETQVQRCREHAERAGWEVTGVFVDPEQSRHDENRLDLHAAIRSLHKGDILLADAPDRIGAGYYLLRVLYDVERKGAEIRCISGWNNEDTPEGRLFRAMIAAFKEYDREAGAARTGWMMRAKQAIGHYVGGRYPPLGWRRVQIGTRTELRKGKNVKLPVYTLEPVESEQATLALILRLHQDGLTAAQIRKELEQRGEQPPRGRWYTTTIQAAIDRAEGRRASRTRSSGSRAIPERDA